MRDSEIISARSYYDSDFGIRESSWMEYPDTVDSVVEIVSDPLLERILRWAKAHVEAACIKGTRIEGLSNSPRLVLDRIAGVPPPIS